MSEVSSLAMREYCTSVIIGKDMIPRLSLRSVERLVGEMLVAASRCKVGSGPPGHQPLAEASIIMLT